MSERDPTVAAPHPIEQARRRADRQQLAAFLGLATFGIAVVILLFSRNPDPAPDPSASLAPAVPVNRPLPAPAPASPTPTAVATALPAPVPEPTTTVVQPVAVTPTSEPTAAPINPADVPAGFAAVNASLGLNVRAEPSFSGAILRVLNDRQLVALAGEVEVGPEGVWQQLADDGGGWVLETYLVLPAQSA